MSHKQPGGGEGDKNNSSEVDIDAQLEKAEDD